MFSDSVFTPILIPFDFDFLFIFNFFPVYNVLCSAYVVLW